MRTSVIIPLYRGERWIARCLAALRAAAPDEIIVVDDASPDGAAAWVEAEAPGVRLLRQPENRGFAAACNAGLRAATGDLLVLLNQDTEVEPGWLAPLVARLADPTIAFVGSRATFPDGRLQHAGGWVDERGEAGHHHEEREAGEVDFVTGASIALRRETLERLGPLDERFAPAYFEDVEWCLRARAAGLRVWYEPASRLIHHEESQLAADDPEAMRRVQRNRLRLVLKHWAGDAFAERFLPAERAWLASLGQGGEALVGVMHRLYFHFLVRLDRYSGSPEEAEARAAALIELLSLLPTRPTELPFRFDPDHVSSEWFPRRRRAAAAPESAPDDAGSAAPIARARGALRGLRPRAARLLRRARSALFSFVTMDATTAGRLDQLERRLDQLERRLEDDENLFVHRFEYHEQLHNNGVDARERLRDVLLAYQRAANQNLGALSRGQGRLDDDVPVGDDSD